MNNLRARKNLGIWMDHSRAVLIEFAHGKTSARTIESEFTPELKQATWTERGEHTMHRKEQRLDAKFFQAISDNILAYDDVLLFGPTDAKQQLFNQVRGDHRFSNTRIRVKTTDKMTGPQLEAFVRDYFLGDESSW